jgi:hypothetical protein
LIHVTVTTSPRATRFGIIAPQDLRNIEILYRPRFLGHRIEAYAA